LVVGLRGSRAAAAAAAAKPGCLCHERDQLLDLLLLLLLLLLMVALGYEQGQLLGLHLSYVLLGTWRLGHHCFHHHHHHLLPLLLGREPPIQQGRLLAVHPGLLLLGTWWSHHQHHCHPLAELRLLLLLGLGQLPLQGCLPAGRTDGGLRGREG
jgi:hypothetical protein